MKTPEHKFKAWNQVQVRSRLIRAAKVGLPAMLTCITASLDPKFDRFFIVSANYKTVKDVPIRADVLIPKSIAAQGASSRARPVMLRFHGGFLVGESAQYRSQLTHTQDIIRLIAPGYLHAVGPAIRRTVRCHHCQCQL